jgi:hypothetical protein
MPQVYTTEALHWTAPRKPRGGAGAFRPSAGLGGGVWARRGAVSAALRSGRT